MKKILVIDDEQSTQISLRMLLKDSFEITSAYNCSEAREILATRHFDLALLDIVMPGQNGLDFLPKLRRSHPNLPVIMVTAIKTVRTAVDAIKNGAAEYLTKPFDAKELINCIHVVLRKQQNSSTVDVIKTDDANSIIYTSAAMTRIIDSLKMVAPEECTVYIHGESGTGKELIANEIHNLSPRRRRPFVAVNCAAIPDTLIENELFGHEKGAYTNAQRSSSGKVDLARGGTLFFDEIGDLSLEGQAKLLRIIQDKKFMRVGGLEEIDIDARFIFATNKDLEVEISRGRFREDLFYRINVIPINVPPLRERPADIRVLLSHFLERTLSMQKKPAKHFSDEALNFLLGYHWPGNVRELKNTVEYLVSLTPKVLIDWPDLPMKIRTNQKFSFTDTKQRPLHEAEEDFQRQIIVNALEKTAFVQTKAAELLGTTRRVLKYRMDKYGIMDKSSAGN